MTVAIFGGTGRTGRLVIKELLAQGHKVRALARDPEKIAPAFGLEFVKGQAWDGGKIMLTLTGCEAVVVCLAPVKGSREDIASLATELILAGMGKLGIKALTVVSALGVFESWESLPLVLRLQYSLGFTKQLRDKERQETLVKNSDRNWVILRAGQLHDRPASAPLSVTTENRTTTGVQSRAGLASLIPKTLGNPEFLGRIWSVTQ